MADHWPWSGSPFSGLYLLFKGRFSASKAFKSRGIRHSDSSQVRRDGNRGSPSKSSGFGRGAGGILTRRIGAKRKFFTAFVISLIALSLGIPEGAPMASAEISSSNSTLTAEVDWPLLLKFSGPTSYQNPLNTSQVEVNAYFDSNSGSITLPCYPYSQGVWAVRFTPLQLEGYSYRVVMKNSSGSFLIASGEIRVLPAATRMDFVTVGKHYFYAGGKPILLVGENVAWASSPGGSAGGWEYYVEKIAESGGNWVRLWSPYAATWFSANYSSLFEFALKQGVYVQLCLFSPYATGSFSKGPEWGQVTPEEFFSSPKMIQLEEFWIRSLIGRYAAFPNLFSWELFNEIDGSPGYSPGLAVAWTKTMVSYIEANDPYHHMISISVADPVNGYPLFSIKGISYAQLHLYGSGPYAIPESVSSWVHQEENNMTTLVAEFGASYKGSVQDPLGVSLELGLWSGVASGSAGTAMTWWWDSFVDPNDLYFYFRSVENVVGKINFSGFSPASLEVSTKNAFSPAFESAISNGTAALIFAVNPEVAENWMNYYASSWLPETTLNVTIGIRPGSYEVEFWDPVTGTVLRALRVYVGQDENLRIQSNFSAAEVVTITPSAYTALPAPGSEREVVIPSSEEQLVIHDVSGVAVAVLRPSSGNDTVVLPVGRYEVGGVWFNLTAGSSPYVLNLEVLRQAQLRQEAAQERFREVVFALICVVLLLIFALAAYEVKRGKRYRLQKRVVRAAGEKVGEAERSMYDRLLNYYSLNMGYQRGLMKLESEISKKMESGMTREEAIRVIYEETMGERV
ncbi:MAG: DUF5060 domain-containing protein [Thermoprotei archaeon]